MSFDNTATTADPNGGGSGSGGEGTPTTSTTADPNGNTNGSNPTTDPNGGSSATTASESSATTASENSSTTASDSSGGGGGETNPTENAKEVCVISNGSFGTIDSPQVQTIVNIEFMYELEMAAGTNIEDVRVPLENSMANILLPSIFPNRCVGENRRRRLEVLGVTTFPDDTVDDQACASVSSADNDCVVMNGKMALYVDSNAQENEEQVLSILETAMGDGAFNAAHPDIVRVAWTEDEPDVVDPNGVITGSDDSRVLSAGVLGFIIVGSAMLMFFLAAFLYRRNRGEKDDEYDPESTMAPDVEALEPGSPKSMLDADMDDTVNQVPSGGSSSMSEF